MGRMPTVVHVFGPSLLGIAAFGLATLFNTITADLTQLRREVTALHTQRLEMATVAQVDAELGTPDEPAPSSPAPVSFEVR